MKKLVFLAVFAFVASAAHSQMAASATAPAAKPDMAVASFENQNFDFGKIKQGTPAEHEFRFTNTGKVPMVITNVSATCGCTTPAWTKDPIPPGGEGFVKATYNAAGLGAFDKGVTITANVENGVIQLRIRGEVVTIVQ